MTPKNNTVNFYLKSISVDVCCSQRVAKTETKQQRLRNFIREHTKMTSRKEVAGGLTFCDRSTKSRRVWQRSVTEGGERGEYISSKFVWRQDVRPTPLCWPLPLPPPPWGAPLLFYAIFRAIFVHSI